MNASPAGDTLPGAARARRRAGARRAAPASARWPRRTSGPRIAGRRRARTSCWCGSGSRSSRSREQRFRKVGTRRAQAISKVVVAAAWRGGDRVAGRADRARLGGRDADPGRPRRRPRSRAGRGRPASVDAAVDALGTAIHPIDDVRSTAAYRREAARRVVRRLLADALDGPGDSATRGGRCRMTELGPNRYGKQSIRLVRVVRGSPSTTSATSRSTSRSRAAFAAAFVAGDNACVVATDTMKNTVYALATEHLDGADRGVRDPRSRRHFLEADAGRRGRRSRSASTPGSRSRPRRPGARRVPAHGCDDADRGRHGTDGRRDRGQRDRGPRGHEDRAVRVLGVPARPLHDAARGPRTGSWPRGSRASWRHAARGGGLGRAPRHASCARCSRCSPITTASRSSTRSG